ncbi:hypothetical protein Areg01_53410 [Actinoplanes regularis]|nr:hypothetical protein Areg01_53410 [Actinoplanes regularis]
MPTDDTTAGDTWVNGTTSDDTTLGNTTTDSTTVGDATTDSTTTNKVPTDDTTAGDTWVNDTTSDDTTVDSAAVGGAGTWGSASIAERFGFGAGQEPIAPVADSTVVSGGTASVHGGTAGAGVADPVDESFRSANGAEYGEETPAGSGEVLGHGSAGVEHHAEVASLVSEPDGVELPGVTDSEHVLDGFHAAGEPFGDESGSGKDAPVSGTTSSTGESAADVIAALFAALKQEIPVAFEYDSPIGGRHESSVSTEQESPATAATDNPVTGRHESPGTAEHESPATAATDNPVTVEDGHSVPVVTEHMTATVDEHTAVVAEHVTTSGNTTTDAQPVDAVEPVEAEPVEVVEPAEAEPVDAVEPVGAEPADVVEPAEAGRVDAVEPVEAEPIDVVEPAEAEPVDAVEPVEAEPADVVEPVAAVAVPAVVDAPAVGGTDSAFAAADPGVDPESSAAPTAATPDAEAGATPAAETVVAGDGEADGVAGTAPEAPDATEAQAVDLNVSTAAAEDAVVHPAQGAEESAEGTDARTGEATDERAEGAGARTGKTSEERTGEADPRAGKTSEGHTADAEGRTGKATEDAGGPTGKTAQDADARSGKAAGEREADADGRTGESGNDRVEDAAVAPIRQRRNQHAPTDRRRADPEEILAAYPWMFDPRTLREQVDEPDRLWDLADRLTDRLEFAERDHDRAGLLSLRAVVSRVLGELDSAVADAREALRHAEASAHARTISVARARLAHVLHWRDEFDEADRLYARADSPELPARVRAEIRELAGRSAFEQGRFLEAVNHFERALDLCQGGDAELVERVELALDVITRRSVDGWGPYPRGRDELLNLPSAPTPLRDDGTGLWGYAAAVEPRYAQAQAFAEGAAWVRRPESNAWELIDPSGTVLIGADSGYLAADKFAEGLAWVTRDPQGGWFAIDRNNRLIVPGGFEDVRPFRNGLALFRRAGGWGAIDRHGRIAVQPKYRQFATVLSTGGPVDGFGEDGFAVVDTGNGLGVVDRTGQPVIPPVHKAVVIHPSAFLIADEAGRWGALDRQGQPLVETRYVERAEAVVELGRVRPDARPVL